MELMLGSNWDGDMWLKSGWDARMFMNGAMPAGLSDVL